MRTTDKLGFKLIIREPNVDERTVVVCPRYDGLKIKWSRPSGKMYFQKELSGNIKFWGVDFETVQACALRTKFTLVVYDRRKGEIARCDFLKTDCKWDINHATCEVDVSSWNPYKKIEASKDNEYNLVRLGINKKTMNFFVYPQNQIYVLNDNKLAMFGISGNGILHDVGQITHMYSLNEMGFLPDPIGIVSRSPSYFSKIRPVVLLTDFTLAPAYEADYGGAAFFSNSDTWDATGQESNYFVYMKKLYKNGIYSSSHYLEFWYYEDAAHSSQALSTRYFRLTLVDGGGIQFMTENIISFSELSLTTSITFYRYTSLGRLDYTVGIPSTTRFCIPVLRLLTAQTLDGRTLTSEDIAASFNNNLKSYATNTSMVSNMVVKVSNVTSEEDKGYGPVENTDLYYDTPDNLQHWTPIYKDAWFGGYSFWLGENNVSDNYKERYQYNATVSDFYLLGNAIKAVLHEIDPDLHFEPDTTHSQFLFSTTNPVGGAQQGALYISQKSNVLNLGYDYPAWQAPVTWGKIETLLNNAFNCYWEIYEENGERHLRIEHRTFFENGGTYDGSSTAGLIDLRTIYRTANRTPFSDKTNRWEWDKDGGSTSSCANRYEYGWMDTQSAIFDGETIEVPEDYQLFEDERVEERKVDWFSSDIDFLTSVQAECSSDGFVIVMESLSNAGWIITGNPNYSGQNYELSFEYMQPLYLLSGMYSPMLKIGDSEQPNTFTSRLRKAEVTFSLPDETNVKAGDLIWTEVGKGLAETLELDLSSDHFTATVRYENE